MAKRTPKKRAESSNSSVASPVAETPSLRVVDRPAHFKGVEQLVWADADSLAEHPDNWKTHTRRQIEALDGQFETVGWAGAMLYNLNTSRLLDGHGRKDTNTVKRQGVVPVLLGRWTPEEEKQILLHLDPVGAMFETDRAKYDALMKDYSARLKAQEQEISPLAHHALDSLNKSLDLQVKSADYGAPSSFLPAYDDENELDRAAKEAKKEVVDIESLPHDIPGPIGLKKWEDIPFDLYGTSGVLGIPPIRPDRLATIPEFAPGERLVPWVGPETPEAACYFYIYGCAAIEKVRSSRMVVAFYTWDHKFESIWSDPRPFTARMLHCKVLAAVSPNFSVYRGAPLAFQAYQIYRSRWLSRYWQEVGLNVIPDIHLARMGDQEEQTVFYAGIPQHAPCLSLQLVNRGLVDDESFYATSKGELMEMVDLLRPQSLLVYRNKLPRDFFKGLPPAIRILEVDSWMGARKKAVAAAQKDKGELHLSKGLT